MNGRNGPAGKLERLLTRDGASETREEIADIARRIRTSTSEERVESADLIKRELSNEDVPSRRAERLRPVVDSLLDDPKRAVRLTAVKGVVALASESPASVKPFAQSLEDLLYDEFYFVRGRSAEALGYLLHDHPDAEGVSSTVVVTLFDALSLDEPEVRRKAAKAVSMVACSRPDEVLRDTGEILEYADGAGPVTRYHLLTALVALGTSASELTQYTPEVETFLEDENPYVRGRAVELLGILGEDVPPLHGYDYTTDEAEEFERSRVERAQSGGHEPLEDPHAETEETVRGIERESRGATLCPNCGEPVPPDAPACPRCGVPQV